MHNQEINDLISQVRELETRLQLKQHEIDTLLHSRSWRITKPCRIIALKIKNRYTKLILRIFRSIKNEGLQITTKKIWKKVFFRKKSFQSGSSSKYMNVQKIIPYMLFNKTILIIAELSIVQCKKYRVDQKKELLEQLGCRCYVVSWTDINTCFSLMQISSLIILYRVPAFPSVLNYFIEAQRLHIPTAWEVDDLIFDRDILSNSRTLQALPKMTFQELLNGAQLYKTALVKSDYAIASTLPLANQMRTVTNGKVFIIENALDQQTLCITETILKTKKSRNDDTILICYGSGTTTHNIDFEECAGALLDILSNYTNVILRIIGHLKLPEGFASYSKQIEVITLCNFEKYLEYLADADINIAPLESTIFNESKSNIKYIEASILKVPSVCSPRKPFADVIVHGVNGFLCNNTEEWCTSFELLINNEKLRKNVGFKAYNTVLKQYSLDNSRKQLAHFLNYFNLKKQKSKKTLLSVNCYYFPRSFGGATIVAEQVNSYLAKNKLFSVAVFTALPVSDIPPYQIRRYSHDDVTVFGIGIPENSTGKQQYINEQINTPFESVLTSLKPDIVHFHSIQSMGISMLELCLKHNIPYVVTLHDAWWLCKKQFLINSNGYYCKHEKIEFSKCCDDCNAQVEFDYATVFTQLRYVLSKAELLLAPSEYFANFYRTNGFKVKVNKNGIFEPQKQIPHKREKKLIRFGYAGGNTEIKGFHLIKKIFSKINNKSIFLTLVDNACNLGFQTYFIDDIKEIHNCKIIPAYTQESIDDFFDVIDVLLFPTQWKESFGLTVREALVRNVWVVSTNAGGVIEDIIEGENGLIIPLSDDGTEFEKAIYTTIDIFNTSAFQESVNLPNDHIRYFDEQATELSIFLNKRNK